MKSLQEQLKPVARQVHADEIERITAQQATLRDELKTLVERHEAAKAAGATATARVQDYHRYNVRTGRMYRHDNGKPVHLTPANSALGNIEADFFEKLGLYKLNQQQLEGMGV